MAQVVAGGGLGQVLKEGQVLADDGAIYTTVQEAQDAASDWIRIGPGTFQENVTIDTAGLEVRGSGRDTLIDGQNAAAALTLAASNILVRDLSVQTDGGGNKQAAETGTGADSCMAMNIWVREAGNQGLRMDVGNDHIVAGCVAEASFGTGIQFVVDRAICIGCRTLANVARAGGDSSGIATNNDDVLIEYNIVNNSQGQGVRVDGNDCVVASNRVLGAGGDGIDIGGTDDVVVDNRVSGSTNADISDGGTNTLLSDNRTGAAN